MSILSRKIIPSMTLRRLPRRLLEHRTIIDVNKDFNDEPCSKLMPASHTLKSPSFAKQASGEEKDKENVVTSFTSSNLEYKICRRHPTGGWLPPVPRHNGEARRFPLQYDYVNTNCLGHIHDFVTHELANHHSVTKQYSVYVVGPGVWETVKPHLCHHPMYSASDKQFPETVYELLQMTLHKLARLADENPSLVIVWRTSGYYDGDKQSSVIDEINRVARNFISEWNAKRRVDGKTKGGNFLCLDFGAAVRERSQGRNRLRGDMQAHYSIEVRILQIQMLVNLLFEHGHI